MAIFTPRTSAQVLRDLIAKVVARTELSDVSAGSTLYTILNAVALEVANTEARLSNIKRSYSIENATGSDLDERVSELPPVGISRKTQQYARGSVLTVRTNDHPTEPLVLPAGSTFVCSENGQEYATAYDYTFDAGINERDDIYIVCTQPGEVGNCSANTITILSGTPDGFIECDNLVALSNGQNQEDDASLRQRALRFVNSLGRTNKSSIEFLGTSFVASSGNSFKFARVYEELEKPGYCELIVDDGAGLTNTGFRDSVRKEITVPEGGLRTITHARPAVSPVRPGFVQIERNGQDLPLAETDFISIPERGILRFRDGFLEEGDIVTILPLKCYAGDIAELQEEIEGNSSRGAVLTGFRAAGTRVRVLPPNITYTSLKASIVVPPTADFDATKRAVTAAITNYINSLDIGARLIPSRLSANLILTQNVINVGLYKSGTTTFLEEVYPSSEKHVLRIKEEDITIVSAN